MSPYKSISPSEEQTIERWLSRFYGGQGEPLTRLQVETLVHLMSLERRELKRQLGMERGG